MGYIHRDLKPDNIMINLDPLEVRIIDFNRVNLTTTITDGHVRGTPGYFPERDNWKDGDAKWDLWAFGAIILEADMILNGYYHCKSELDAYAFATKHIREPKTCKHVVKIIRKTLMTQRGESVIGWEEMVKELKEAQFKRQGHDKVN
jgi:serine/threonine protein kinase